MVDCRQNTVSASKTGCWNNSFSEAASNFSTCQRDRRCDYLVLGTQGFPIPLFVQIHVDIFKMAMSSSPDVAIQDNAELSFNTRKSLDKAAVYLHDHGCLSEEGSVNAKTLLRKLDWRLIPLAFACTTVQFLDKFAINVCAVVLVLRDTIEITLFHISMQLSWE